MLNKREKGKKDREKIFTNRKGRERQKYFWKEMGEERNEEVNCNEHTLFILCTLHYTTHVREVSI